MFGLETRGFLPAVGQNDGGFGFEGPDRWHQSEKRRLTEGIYDVTEARV